MCGPLAHSARDIDLFMSVVRAAQPWHVDPAVLPSIFEAPTSSRTPVVGILRQSALTPHPSVRRAIDEAATKL